MTPETLEAAVEELFPVNGKGTLSAALGVDASTCWRYFQRETVPGAVAAAVEAWLRLKRDFEISPPGRPSTSEELKQLILKVDVDFEYESGLSGLEMAALFLFGDAAKSKLAKLLGVDASTLWRQMVNDTVTGPVAAAVRAHVMLKRLTGLEPPVPVIPNTKKKAVPKYARLISD